MAPSSRWLATGLIVVVALLTSTAGPVHGRDPWKSRGRDAPDRERYEVQPAGFKDRKGPAEVDPPGTARVAKTNRTNIVVIMIDDHPEIDLRVWKRLPHIRRLFLRQGLRFTRFYGNDPMCCPGRANFLTGLTTDHHGVWTNDARLLDADATLATELRAAGYFTFLAGKYLNNKIWLIDKTPPGWSRSAFTTHAFYNYNEWVNGRRGFHDDDANDYQPDVAFNRALGFLRKAPPRKPVFALITPFSPHAGRDPKRPGWPYEYAPIAPRFRRDSRCHGVPRWLTAAHADDNSDRPAYQRRWSAFRDGYDSAKLCRALLAVDAGIGRVVDELRAQGRLRNTLLVLTADNGMGWGAHGWYEKRVSFATHLPLYVRWPAGRGRTSGTDGTYLSNVDLAPTLCDVGGCVMGPYPGGPAESDGTSFLGVIRGTGEVHRQAIYSEHLATPLWRQLTTTPDSPLGLWHYVEYETGERELYDASGGQCWEWKAVDAGDPCHLTNLAGHPDYADLEVKLHDMLAAAVRTGGAGVRFSGRKERGR